MSDVCYTEGSLVRYFERDNLLFVQMLHDYILRLNSTYASGLDTFVMLFSDPFRHKSVASEQEHGERKGVERHCTSRRYHRHPTCPSCHLFYVSSHLV